MELRHRGLETGSCIRLGEGERDGGREHKRKEQESGNIGIHIRIHVEVRENMWLKQEDDPVLSMS